MTTATPTDVKPFLSIVVPCRSEFSWIGRCLDSLLRQDYPRERLEVLVVDGMSTDGTRAVLQPFLEQHPVIRLLDNPRQSAPAALNIGIAAAKGDIVMRVDAHYEYPPHYASRLVHWLQQSGADNVGGIVVMEPANQTAIARAIAVAVCHPFGIGNAYYRIGTAEPRWVDTVPFGCYPRHVFERIGLFDEEMVRSQDIEFNLRLRQAGGSILLVPDVVFHGHARESLTKMARMYYQYAYFNPLVIRKVGGHITSRQAVTPLFVVSLLLCAVLAPWLAWMRVALAAILIAYILPVLACSLMVALRRGLRCGLWLCMVFPVLHISHGVGFLQGLLDFVIFRRDPRNTAKKLPLTR